MGTDGLKLNIEFVPKPLHHKNLRYLLKPKIWQDIRKEVMRTRGMVCSVCGRSPKKTPDCHEVWHYDDKMFIQSLADIVPLCKTCHLVKHIGFATILALDDNCNLQGIIRKFCSVNNCTIDRFMEHYYKELEKWDWRNEQEWEQDISFIYAFGVNLLR